MFRKFVSVLSVLCLIVSLFACSKSDVVQDASLGKNAKKFEYKAGDTIKEVIPFIYEYADNFSEGLAAVNLNNKWGYIDKTGKEVIPFIYEYAGDFSEGLANVKINGKLGYIDKTGKEVIPFIYGGAGIFLEGLANVQVNGKCGYIDKTGKEVMPPIYDDARFGGFYEGFAAVCKDGKYGFITYLPEYQTGYGNGGSSQSFSSGGGSTYNYNSGSSSSGTSGNSSSGASQVNSKKSYKEIKNINSSEQYSQETPIEEMDTVSFGTYEKDGRKEEIEWIVLEKSGGEAILLSKYILDCQQYNSAKGNMTWEESGIRKWLNGTFFTTAFSSEEQSIILDSSIENNDNVKAGTMGGNPTVDKVYLLSIDECIKYFGEPNTTNQIVKLSTYGTNYAKNRGLFVVNDESAWYNGYSPFWLRSPGAQQSRAAVVNYCGYFYADGNSVDFKLNGVRPVIKIKLN